MKSRAIQNHYLRRVYYDERRWLRARIHELASRAAETAQSLQLALAEKEIRDRRPLLLILGSPFVSIEAIMSAFDRDFPADPCEGKEDGNCSATV
jgi:hypothetical protein